MKPNDPYSLKNAIENIYYNRDKLMFIQNNARLVADTVFAKERVLERYYALLS